MIVARDLTKWFGRTLAVDSIDFTVPQGQVVGFLGPNGAGKTTTIRMISGFLPPTAGRITVDEMDVATRWRDVRRRIGYLPESAPLYTEMRVHEYLRFRSKIFGIPRRQRQAMIEKALARCWLTDVQRRPINQLSRGYRQRVGLAAALLHEPPVLILDEPTVGLDPAQIREVRTLIRELAGRHTILLSTHILPEVELTCDRIMMIARGRIRAEGTVDELRAEAARESRYVLETNLAAADADRVIRSVSGVADLEAAATDGRWRRYHVRAEESAGDLREALALAINQAGAMARELSREAPRLEHLFMKHVAAAEEDYDRGGPRPDGAPGAEHRHRPAPKEQAEDSKATREVAV